MNESIVWLREGATGNPVQASLFDEITDDHLLLWSTTWSPEMRRYVAANAPTDRPEDSHWNWRIKSFSSSGLLSCHSFSLVCNGELQALMIARDLASAKLPGQFGQPLVHLEFVATAPWNRPEFHQPVRYKGCGRILILAAIEVSRACGGKGRIGLHSLPAAEDFYEQKCGMTLLGADAAHQNLSYFEMTETQADQFRRNQMKP